MALATKCPHCHTVFRVALDQLKLRGGIVRCGACNEIFDGNAALVEPSAFAAGAAIPVLMPAPAVPAGLDLELDLDEVVVAQEAPGSGPNDPEPLKPPPGPDPSGPTLASAAGVNAAAGALAVPEPEADPEPDSEPDLEPDPEHFIDIGRREPAFDMPSEHIVAIALDDRHHFDDAPEPAASAPASDDATAPAIDDPADDSSDDSADDAAGRAADDAAAADLLTAAPESALLAAGAGTAAASIAPATRERDDEPEFVRQADRRERTRSMSRLAMTAGIPLLAVALLAQGAYTLRNRLAADHPAMKPALEALCAPLGCTVGLPRQIDALAIEQGELQTLAPNTFSFVTVLRNGSRSVQAWPHIELVLNDAADRPVLRRVFAPRDYLARPADVAQGFGPRSEQSVKLYFQLDRLRASGYHIAIFHP
ncbi:DUF3426 domain-containing protein [Massilia dura]|uniref:DUF3426 domain-containing protein n=1 Tax=Pseudoduganella dura TaxID=321982 RepID=A0A6I3XNS8_9BURK|nr:DUF3426 domain-containing protein [Pseudoduganella dura]MUI14278.1 DUF3426 domain-containing protein [Pseudoduganella dura]GGX76104.1 hypothetical protein GCM10007386_03620 [Pseudoduganella dura]